MKVRLGFVGNSSSSSFLIFGSEVSSALYQVLYRLLNGAEESEFFRDIIVDGRSDKECFYEVCEKIRAFVESMGLTFIYGRYDEIYIGKSWDEIQDYETGKEFKDNISRLMSVLSKEINKEFPSPKTHEDAWCDKGA